MSQRATALFPSRRVWTAALAAAVWMAGCASGPAVEGQWRAPDAGDHLLRGATVLVACEADDPVVLRICQDDLMAGLTARGARPQLAPPLPLGQPGEPLPDARYAAPARAAGASVVMVSTISAWAGAEPGPAFSLGLGGFGFGGGHTGVGGGVGVAVPVGGDRSITRYATNTRLLNSADTRVLWTVRASAPASAEMQQPLADLAQAALDAAERAALF